MVLTLLSMCLNFGGTFFLHEFLHLDPRFSFALVLAIAYVMNFLLARFWVFSSAQMTIGKQLTRFLATSLCFRIGEYLTFTLLYTYLGLWYLLAVFISLCSFYAVKFLTYRFFVFKPHGRGAHG
ncbi:MAG: GtrA family protein [Kiritimatiellae bacterium]|nr:GtrA family protein [Kiritimatiellia bacterium]